MNACDFGRLKDLVIGASMIGLLGPLMAIGWWNATSRRPATPLLIKGIWIFFGSVGGLTLLAGVSLRAFHIRFW